MQILLFFLLEEKMMWSFFASGSDCCDLSNPFKGKLQSLKTDSIWLWISRGRWVFTDTSNILSTISSLHLQTVVDWEREREREYADCGRGKTPAKKLDTSTHKGRSRYAYNTCTWRVFSCNTYFAFVKQEVDEREAQVRSLQGSKKNKKKPRQKATPREHNNPGRKRSGGTPMRSFDDSFSREATKPQNPAQKKRTMIRVFQQRASPRRRRRRRSKLHPSSATLFCVCFSSLLVLLQMYYCCNPYWTQWSGRNSFEVHFLGQFSRSASGNLFLAEGYLHHHLLL
jgi:hypothetical protein